jgi:hypothetical protein
MKWFGLAGAAAGMALAAAPASAELFVSGDSNIFSPFLTGGNATAGNQQFLANLIDGSNVVVRSSLQLGTNGQNLTNYLGGAGYAVSTVGAETAFTAGDFVGQDLVILLGITGSFTAAEATALRNYVDGGGNALVVGENGTFFAEMNNTLNSLLTALGSGMRLTNNAIDPGLTETAIILEDNAYTAGTGGLKYIFPSGVTGGQGLYGVRSNGEAFVAYDAAVPEPAAWALMIAGFGLAGSALRRRTAAA